MPIRSFLSTSLLGLFGVSIILGMNGCAIRSSSSGAARSIVDSAYLTADRWDDGKAEVAFYRVERTRNQYGESADQSFLVGTYLVKHDFDPEAMSKTTTPSEGVQAFKYAIFYEFESGSYQYKRSYVTNARRRDLRPLKHSFTSFDWCSNQYRELAFHPGGTVDYLMRSDDYGNRTNAFDYRSNAYPVAQLPLLVRGLSFADTSARRFSVVLPDGEYVSARAHRVGADTLELAMGAVPAERIEVNYDRPVPSPIAEETDTTEVYWRGAGLERRLLQLKGGSGRYQMNLVEQLRIAYWDETLWPRLTHINKRP